MLHFTQGVSKTKTLTAAHKHLSLYLEARTSHTCSGCCCCISFEAVPKQIGACRPPCVSCSYVAAQKSLTAADVSNSPTPEKVSSSTLAVLLLMPHLTHAEGYAAAELAEAAAQQVVLRGPSLHRAYLRP